MANEGTISGSIKFTKGTAPSNLSLSRAISSQTFDVSGTAGIQNIINVGTTDEALVLGDIGTIGYCYFKNLDATNYITLGPDGSSYPIKLKAGEFALLRWSGAAVHAKANTASCNMEYILLPD